MIELPHIALTRWGSWTRSTPIFQGDGLAFNYRKKSLLDTEEPNHEDLIAEMVDRAVASMPQKMAMVEMALRKKYLSNQTNYAAAKLMHTSEGTYRVMVRDGQIWVLGCLTTLHSQVDCPAELKEFFSQAEQLEEIRLPNGPMQRRGSSGPKREPNISVLNQPKISIK